MLFQEILVFTLFIGAIGFIGTIFWKSLTGDPDNGGGGCSSCTAKDLKKVQGHFFKHPKRK